MQLIINLFRSVRFPENSLGIIISASFKEALFAAGFWFKREAISFGFDWEELNCRREVRKV